MRLLCFAPALFAAFPAIADDCHDEIAALFDGGALDPFAQPAFAYDTVVKTDQGAVKYEYHTVFDTPMKSMSGLKGQMVTLAIDNRTWTAPGPDGPWTEFPNQNPDDMEAFQKSIRDQQAKNLSDTECLGPVVKDGAPMTSYRYTTQTDPNEAMGGTYFGSTRTVFIAPDTGRLMRVEETGAFSHYQPDPSTDQSVLVYSYDPTLSLSAPED